MLFLKTKHQRKSILITSIILTIVLWSLCNFGMSYQDPPPEYGIAVNFGNTDTGKQEVKREQIIKEESEQTLAKNQESSQKNPTNSGENFITEQEALQSDAVKKKKSIKPKLQKKISKATQKALSNLLKQASSKKSKSQGNDDQRGLKGEKKGNLDNDSYYGNSDIEDGKNYNLSGRTVLKKPIFQPNCNEEGTVYVRIEVNQNGKVIKAIAGIKGTTNTAPCLLKPAKKAALQTRWNMDKNAPKKQIGIIIYKFRLSQ